ncbi:MAG: glycerate kinase [Rhodobacteraceae bacterium]|nr:glycerate kinase [Paracoccaceae bacterium]
MEISDRKILRQLFEAAVDAADPKKILPPNLPAPPKGKTVVIGCGKGVAQMAAALEQSWDSDLSGVVVTRYGFSEKCKKINVLEAAHPVPDENGLRASNSIFEVLEGLTADDLVIALICGGGSALLPFPPTDFNLSDEQELNKVLLNSGAPIGVMNAIRKHFSQVKGGQLALAAYPAPVVTLVVSDVPGDDPSQVASGPTIADKVSIQEAISLVNAYKIDLPTNIKEYFEKEMTNAPSFDDPRFSKNDVKVIASSNISLIAASKKAEELGFQPYILSDAIEGRASDVGIMHAALAKYRKDKNTTFQRPAVILSGGETTVEILDKPGRGGRNTEFLLAFALSIEKEPNITALAADTDGIDGSENNAGAFCDGATAFKMREKGFNPRMHLIKHDAWTAFNGVDELFTPGPTGTNVNDFRAILLS